MTTVSDTIKTNTLDTVTTTTMNIGTTSATNINIGNTGNAGITTVNNLTSIGSITGSSLLSSSLNTNGTLTIGDLASTTDISIAKPLTLTSPLTLGSGATGDSQLGYTFITGSTGSNFAAVTTAGGGNTILFSTPSLPAGVWSISYGIRMVSAAGTITASNIIAFIQGTPAVTNMNVLCPWGGGKTFTIGTSTSNCIFISGSVIVKTTASTVFNLKYYLTSASGVNFFGAQCYLTATRIG